MHIWSPRWQVSALGLRLVQELAGSEVLSGQDSDSGRSSRLGHGLELSAVGSWGCAWCLVFSLHLLARPHLPAFGNIVVDLMTVSTCRQELQRRER